METTIIKPQRKRASVDKKFLIILLIILVVLAGSVLAVFIIDHNRHEYYDNLVADAEELVIQKKYDDAEKKCKEAIDLFPAKEQAYLIFAELYTGRGNKEDAKTILEKGYEETSSEKVNKQLELVRTDIQYDEYIKAGNDALKKNNYNDAIRYFKAAIDLKPAVDEPYLLAAESYIANGEKSSARDILRDGYDKTGSDRIRGKMIVVEGELQNAEHQKTTQYEAEREAQEAKRRADEEKRLKAEEEQRKKEEAKAKQDALKLSKKKEWKDSYVEVLKYFIAKSTDPNFEDPYIREIDDELSEEYDDEDSDSENTDDGDTDDEDSVTYDEDSDEEEESSADEESDEEDSEDSDEESSEGSDKKKDTEYAFELYDIDSDGIPELFISSSGKDDAEVACYTYANDTAVPLDNHNYKGKISVYQGEKLVMFTSIIDGFRHIDVFKKHGINLDTYITFFDNFSAKVTENYKKSSTINGNEAEQGEYNIELRKINAYSWKDIGRKYKLNDDNIEKGIDAWHM